MVAAAKLTCLRRAALGYFIACLLLASELAATRDDRGIGELGQDTVTQPLDQFSTTLAGSSRLAVPAVSPLTPNC